MLEDLLKGVPVTVGELHGLGWNASGAELEADEARLRRVLAVYEGQFLPAAPSRQVYECIREG
jgi:hypothetical protein